MPMSAWACFLVKTHVHADVDMTPITKRYHYRLTDHTASGAVCPSIHRADFTHLRLPASIRFGLGPTGRFC